MLAVVQHDVRHLLRPVGKFGHLEQFFANRPVQVRHQHDAHLALAEARRKHQNPAENAGAVLALGAVIELLTVNSSPHKLTVIVLAIGGFHPVLDLGRPERMLNIFTAGRLQSPLLWDVSSITAYFMASTVYLYIPMIPGSPSSPVNCPLKSGS